MLTLAISVFRLSFEISDGIFLELVEVSDDAGDSDIIEALGELISLYALEFCESSTLEELHSLSSWSS